MVLVVNEVIDKEVDKEMTKVVVEVNKNLVKEVNEGLVVVCRTYLIFVIFFPPTQFFT